MTNQIGTMVVIFGGIFLIIALAAQGWLSDRKHAKRHDVTS